MNLKIPELSLIVLIGSSGSGKSTFAKKHFKPTEILSSDYCRGLVLDDENNQEATKPAFEVLHFIASKRLEAGKLTVIDATNVQMSARKPLIELAKKHHFLPVAIVLDMPEKICEERNKNREDRKFGNHVIKQQKQQLKKSSKKLKRDGFRYVFTLKTEEEVNDAKIERQPLWNNRKDIKGPFDIIGDIHGCGNELELLLEKLGYEINSIDHDFNGFGFNIKHPDGRKVIFLGDLTDRGPESVKTLKIVMSMVNSESAFCVPGNHDIKLYRKLMGKNVQVKHGLEKTMEQLDGQTEEFIEHVKKFIDALVSHYILDEGKLVVAHGGMKESLQGRASGKVRDFALYGETTGEIDQFGLPERYNWADEYRGKAMVVYGHTPVTELEWVNNTIDIDTGCVFGGKLTSLRYPEKEFVSVDALFKYYEPAKPFDAVVETKYENPDRDIDMLDISDVTGKKILTTRLSRNIGIPENNSAAALEVMSRFSVDPHWIIYLPPTMSPSETSTLDEYLEHPGEAFNYFKKRGIDKVVCEEKHMGSRAVVIACKDEETARIKFKAMDGEKGICYTRTGREFFTDLNLKKEFMEEVVTSLTKSDFWSKFETDWVCLDCELMPWSAKAQQLLKEQYSAVGVAGVNSLSQAVPLLELANNNDVLKFEVSSVTSGKNMDLQGVTNFYKERLGLINDYVKAYRNYCWPVDSINDYKLAPFHIMAVEGETFTNKDHLWHMKEIKEICEVSNNLIMATNHMEIDLTNQDSIEEGITWWYKLTEKGGEGMVVKPLDFTVKNHNGLIQPAIKCRGKEYLRIIYGPEYTLEENIKILKKRSVGKKRSLAVREYALGIEALERFVRQEPIYRVHECVFGVLALESEPVDPRL